MSEENTYVHPQTGEVIKITPAAATEATPAAAPAAAPETIVEKAKAELDKIKDDIEAEAKKGALTEVEQKVKAEVEHVVEEIEADAKKVETGIEGGLKKLFGKKSA